MTKLPTIMQMLEALISSPSVSSTHPQFDSSNLPVIHLLANWLDALGFQIEIVELPANPGKANLIARIGEGCDGLILSGHTDTVPYDDTLWNFDPFKVTLKENKIFGLGTTDMKSFFACALNAIDAIEFKKLRKPIVLLATADEESTMAGAKYIKEHYSKLGNYCVIGEPTSLKPVRQHKGIFMEKVVLQGRSGHSSDPSLGNNALEGMHEVMNTILQYRHSLASRFHNENFAVPVPTLNLGHIHGGDNPNRICANCELHYDLRILPGMDIETIRNNLREQIAEVAAKTKLQCEFVSLFDGIPALSTPGTSKIVSIAEKISGQRSDAVVFATEAPYFSEMGTETIIFGPGNINVAHQPDEFILQEQIEPAVQMYRSFIEKTCCE